MGFAEYGDHDGLGLAELVRRREVTPAELVEAAIERIERHNPVLNAVVYKAYDEARRTAGERLPDGPFTGVPFLVKDLGCPVGGWPRTSGSRFTKDEVPAADGALTRRFREAGVVLLGKTNTPEFGITGTTESVLLGPCRTPWNPDHIAGGSSGGAAAAVASGMVPLAHASDGLGSIRIPAACCGLVGLKITRDRNPGGAEDAERAIGFVVEHVVTRSVRDSAAMLDATGYPEAASPYAPPPKARPYVEEIRTPPGCLRIAFSAETPDGHAIDPEIKDALARVARWLEDLGHHVEERGLDVDYRRLYAAQRAVSTASFAAEMAERVREAGREPDPDELEPNTWAVLLSGRRRSGEEVMAAWGTLRVMCRRVLQRFETFDVFLTPMRGTALPRIGDLGPGQDPRELNRKQARALPFTPPFNLTGQPAVSLPLVHTADGLPLGMQLVGRYADEATLFRLAAQLEQAHPWRGRKPRLWG